MYTVTKYPQGTFSWADTSSTDSAASKRFYMGLFGWGNFDIPVGEGMTYTMFQLDGQNVAALSEATPEAIEQNIPSHWSCYVTVDDVDAILPVATANGAQIIYGPMDVFDSGRMAFIMDPTGAALGLWQARNHIGAGIVNTVGAMCWNELLTKDAAAAQAFYGALFGWEFCEDENGYIRILNNGRNNGAMMQISPMMGEMPSMWQPYFTVADIDESISKAAELGGKIIIPKTEAPGAGHFAYLQDAAGAYLYIIQLIQAEPWIE